MNIYFDDSFKNMLFKGQTEAIRNIEKVFCEKLKYFFKYSENIGIKFLRIIFQTSIIGWTDSINHCLVNSHSCFN